MTHPYDGSSIDLEKALTRYMVERRVTRRQLLEAIAKVGPVVALAPVLAACSKIGPAVPSSAASAAATTASPSATAAAVASAAASATPTEAPSAAPTPVPKPEDELLIYNWTQYIADDTIPNFEKKYPNVKVKQNFFANTEEAYAKLGSDGGGYDISFPTSVDIPTFLAKNALLPLDKSLIPNIANLSAEWQDPTYDPGNAHSVPYMWWTTGVAYDTGRIKEALTSSKALWDPRWSKHIAMLDDMQEVFALALIQLGFDANTSDQGQLDQALALLEQQKPLVRVYSTDTNSTMSSGDVWIGQVWGADLYTIQQENAKMTYYIPEEGGVRGSDTMAIFSGAKHPVAANLFINHMLDAQTSADNTNFIGYMGPNAAAKQFIDPTIIANPAINPDASLIAKLQELISLSGSQRDAYLSRWQTLRGG